MEDLKIEYSYNDDLVPVYLATFYLKDEKTNAKSEQSFQKPATNFINNYFQGLCHAYLESKKYAEKSLASLKTLTEDAINEIIDFLSLDLSKIIEMAKCKIKFKMKNNQISYMFFLIVTEHIPKLTNTNINTYDSNKSKSADYEPELT